jgi:aspartyl-tRNA(Asn)/glutamyl-tRNA(Gln) amidotransferase subunit C
VALTAKDIQQIAHLARLEVSEAEAPAYTEKLGKIIGFIDALNQADTGELLPMAHPLAMSQRLRADTVTAQDHRDHYQQNATEKADGLYIVPRVVE